MAFQRRPLGKETKNEKGQDLREVSGPKGLEELKELTKARDHRVFFGALDASKQGFFFRAMRRSEAARKAIPEGDFRDWKEIESWSRKISEDLENLPKAQV